jgi:hypothetical protein
LSVRLNQSAGIVRGSLVQGALCVHPSFWPSVWIAGAGPSADAHVGTTGGELTIATAHKPWRQVIPISPIAALLSDR